MRNATSHLPSERAGQPTRHTRLAPGDLPAASQVPALRRSQRELILASLIACPDKGSPAPRARQI